MERFIFNQLIVDSGKDKDSRPILSVFCSHFPDPEITDYDELLDLSLKRLNRIVANEYILVVFTEPMEFSPSLGWMLEAYKSLKRDYKKNIKQLIIVHPSWWFKFLVGFMQNIVSSKFAKKIVNVECIEDLDLVVNTDEIMIPADVRRHDQEEFGEQYNEEEIERAKEIMDSGRTPGIFKVSLSVSCPETDYPEEIKDLMLHLTNTGLKSESIFRKSPNKEMLDVVVNLMNTHQKINFSDYDNYTLASVLKEFIRELPETLIPVCGYEALSDPSIMTMEDNELIPFVYSNFVKPLDERTSKLLKDLMMLSAMTAQLSHTNRMSTKALAVVWAPNMIRMDLKIEEMKIITSVIRVVECMIVNYDQVFCNRIW